ncbi:MAG: hypothetical protein V9H69_18300 [Anaerolineae bacterium]
MPRVLFTDEAGRMILEEAEPQFYVKGLWIGPARPYGASCAFGYNLNLKLAEDRQLADAWQASRGDRPAVGQRRGPRAARPLLAGRGRPAG